MVGNTFFHVSRGLSERKIFIKLFFWKKFFGPWEKSFQTFDVLLIDKAFKTAFFLPEELCDAEQFFFQVNDITIKKFWPPTVSFLDFWWKRLAGILEFNYSCPDELSEKIICFTKFPTFMNLFGHWAENVQSFVLLCSSTGPSKKQPMCPEVVCDEKQKVSNVSTKGDFSYLFTDYDRKSLHFRKNIIFLVLKNPILCVQRNVLGETQNLCIKKLFFFVKSYRSLRQKILDFWGSCFRQGCHHSVLFLPRKVSEKTSWKKVFFSIFADLEQ